MSVGRVGLRHSCETKEDSKHFCVLNVAQSWLRAGLCGQEERDLPGLDFRRKRGMC